ncbi:hypothetical protein ANN_16391 [Periplaneta americana]|uniref:Uncharacterized protein n=1 Tax=Periplaneta americana TaxID=6978 RepID=A0ABQ8SK27_PERAM|nr:hypothetical protein ANN_16391 [Periplaneta americana]
MYVFACDTICFVGMMYVCTPMASPILPLHSCLSLAAIFQFCNRRKLAAVKSCGGFRMDYPELHVGSIAVLYCGLHLQQWRTLVGCMWTIRKSMYSPPGFSAVAYIFLPMFARFLFNSEHVKLLLLDAISDALSSDSEGGCNSSTRCGVVGTGGSGSTACGIMEIGGSGSTGCGIMGIGGSGSTDSGIMGTSGSGSTGCGIVGIGGSGSTGCGIMSIGGSV